MSRGFAETLFARSRVCGSSMICARRHAPLRPVEELRAEALKDKPPIEDGTFRHPDLVELVKLDPTIKLDIRYATTNNFLGTPVYTQARAFLERPAAEALVMTGGAVATWPNAITRSISLPGSHSRPSGLKRGL